MTETGLGVLIVVVLLIFLVLAAFWLERRARSKGALLTGEKTNLQEDSRVEFYIYLLTVIGSALLFTWSFLRGWVPGQVIFGIVFVISFGYGQFIRIRNLLTKK